MISGRRIATQGVLRKVALVLGLLLLVALGYGGARYWQASGDSFSRLELSADCDLRAGPCRHARSGGVITFAVEPRSIPLMQPLRLEVTTDGLDADEVLVEIRGLNMDMGLNRTRLQRNADGRWHGETILPICSQRRMHWEAAVRLKGSERLEIPFPFSTERR